MSVSTLIVKSSAVHDIQSLRLLLWRTVMANTAIQVNLKDEDRERLDAYRRAQADPPPRAIAARRLLCEALIREAGEDQSRLHAINGVQATE